MARSFWSERELGIVREMYPNFPTKVIAEKLGRRIGSVYQCAAKLGLHKSDEYLQSPDACRLRRGDEIGKAFRFKKGQVPANKGLRRPGWAPGRMRETQFKQGGRYGAAAKNWFPVGTIRKDAEGFLRIKVREWHRGERFGFGNTEIWPLLNRHIWEQHHGPIPPSHAVVFRDRNRQNCDISNLELISRADLMKRNTVHNLPKDVALSVQLLGAIRRQINRKEKYGKEHDAGSSQPSL
jgi:hypothetical protein